MAKFFLTNINMFGKEKSMINKIQPYEQPKRNNKKDSFKGAGTAVLTGLRALNNSPAVGACAVDLCSMVIPRTVIEAKNRGPQSGIETFIREMTSNLIHACVGLIGLGSAIVLSGKFNKEYGIKAQNIFASGETIQSVSEMWKNSNGQRDFFNNFVGNLKGLNGTEWKAVSESAKDEIVDGLVSLADKRKELVSVSGAKKKQLALEAKNIKSSIIAKVTKDTGAQASFRLNGINGAKELSASFGELVDNAVGITNSFTKDKVKDNLPKFINALKKNKTATTILGMGICAALCMSVQPINRYLTKKRTGSDGFVGVENDKQSEKNKPQGYKKAKTILGIAFPLAALRTTGKYSDLIKNIQFNSKVPRINQFKFLYGLTIGSRFLSARDGNELRESVIKDTLGFTNWLILGGMVSKLTARAIGGKQLINNPIVQDNSKKGIKYAFKWLTNASVKSFDEVLLPTAKEIIKDGKVKSFSELYKNADSAVKTQVKKIAGSQIAGYLYSGLVLGVGISKLNIFITRTLNKKKSQKLMVDTVNAKPDTVNIPQFKELMDPVFKDFI